MKTRITTLLLTLATLTAGAQSLTFNAEGKLKIAQFTDTHIDLGTAERRAEAEKTLKQLRYILSAERPDVVIFTGDVVTGRPAAEGWRTILAPLAEQATPFCVTLGNHDREQDLTGHEIARIVTSYPNSLNTLDCDTLADFAVQVRNRGDGKTEALLYIMDSHDYSTVEGLEGYGWLTAEQIAWYRARSRHFTEANDGKPLPALAFLHIPLPEYTDFSSKETTAAVGQRTEDECPGILNTGMFAAFVESGDVKGVFAGHDHDNDFLFIKQGIALGYGRFSGDNTTYNDLNRGIRIIEITKGSTNFETWIHERNGKITDRVVCNGKTLINQ